MTRRKKSRSRLKPARFIKWLAVLVLAIVALSLLLVLPLRWIDPPTTAFMLQDSSGRDPLLHEWVGWDQLGTAAPLAVVSAEDQRFADHRGIDFTAMQKALDEQKDRGYLRGASTISQQTAKNLFLWPGRSFVRKGLEAWLTLVGELCLSKQRILEIYLNIAEFGPGIYGVGAASHYYFGRSPSELSDPQAALIAAALPSPQRFNIANPSEHVRTRQAWILTQMARLRREAWLLRVTH